MNKIRLEKISVKQPELDRISVWRDNALAMLRTADLTAPGSSQEDWVRNMKDTDKYYFIYYDNIRNPIISCNDFIGYCGLDKIHMANRTAEISLFITPEYRKTGLGSSAIRELLNLGFDNFNLNLIYGEVYHTTSNVDFWLKQGFKEEGTLRSRKYFKGKYYDSTMFSMTAEEWRKYRRWRKYENIRNEKFVCSPLKQR